MLPVPDVAGQLTQADLQFLLALPELPLAGAHVQAGGRLYGRDRGLPSEAIAVASSEVEASGWGVFAEAEAPAVAALAMAESVVDAISMAQAAAGAGIIGLAEGGSGAALPPVVAMAEAYAVAAEGSAWSLSEWEMDLEREDEALLGLLSM